MLEKEDYVENRRKMEKIRISVFFKKQRIIKYCCVGNEGIKEIIKKYK